MLQRASSRNIWGLSLINPKPDCLFSSKYEEDDSDDEEFAKRMEVA